MFLIKAAAVLSIMTWHAPYDPAKQFRAEGVVPLDICEYAKLNYERLANIYRGDPSYQNFKVECVDPVTRRPLQPVYVPRPPPRFGAS